MGKNVVYLEKLSKYKDSFSVKVITGIRGVGKTKLLMEFAETLKNDGVPPEKIIFINFDEFEQIADFQQLYEFVNEKIMYLDQAYLLFDEIDRVQGWEKAINAFFVGAPVDIYITSSNFGVLSKDFLALLSKNYELIYMQPLPFNEYVNLFSTDEDFDMAEVFQQYLNYGGLPIAAQCSRSTNIVKILLSGIYHTALNKDVIARYGVRDAALIHSMNKFLALNIGKPVNHKVIDDYLSSVNHSTTGYTMDNYLNLIDESGIFRRVERYDLRARTTINGSERFYCADTGICNVLAGDDNLTIDSLLENIVCIELWRRGYEVFVGKIGEMKVSFVGIKNSNYVYYQVVSHIENKSQLRKILNPLERIRDQYSKFILSMDNPVPSDYNGIKNCNIFDFLVGNV